MLVLIRLMRFHVLQTMIVGVLILLMVVNVHSLWIYELLPSQQCGVDHQRRDFEAVVWPWISATVNVYLPLAIAPKGQFRNPISLIPLADHGYWRMDHRERAITKAASKQHTL